MVFIKDAYFVEVSPTPYATEMLIWKSTSNGGLGHFFISLQIEATLHILILAPSQFLCENCIDI